MLLVDDYTRMNAVFFLRNKSEDFENFKVYNANGFQIDIYFLDTCNAYNNSHSKKSNAHKQHWKKSLLAMERNTSKCEEL